VKRRFGLAMAVVAAALLLAGCSSGGGAGASTTTAPVLLFQHGSRATNAYGLAYQTCKTTPISKIAKDVKAASTDPATVARAYARADFSPGIRFAAARGCLDALQGKSPSPPAAPSPSASG